MTSTAPLGIQDRIFVTYSKHGPNGYRMMLRGVEIAYINRGPDSGWSLLIPGHSKHIQGLRSLNACRDFLFDQVLGSPFMYDPSYVSSHVEHSRDGLTWTTDVTTLNPVAGERIYTRWVGVGSPLTTTYNPPAERDTL